MLNTKIKQSGFTIVELLIVIVVIAILAAISIVAYNGIQTRGKNSSAVALASTIDKKLEAWNSIQGSYPNYCQFVTNTTNPTGGLPTAGTGLGSTNPCVAGSTTGPSEAKLDNVGIVSAVASTVTSGTGTNTVYLSDMSTTGARINYWSYSSSTPALTTSASTPASPTAGTP